MDQLSIRLQMVYDFIDKDRASKGRVIDVGSDHGLLALSCLTTNLTPFCICTDIHKMPAERTRQCLEEASMEERSEVFCTDGLKGVKLNAFDSVIMAGLGGNTTVDIITEALESNSEDILKEVDFILQPQKSADRLRVFLCENGFEIVDETVSKDRDFYYVCIKTRFTGIKNSISSKEKFYGPKLLLKDEPIGEEYFAHLTDVYKVRSRGDEELKALLEEMNV